MTDPTHDAPLVSIGVPAYNEESTLEATVDDLLRQTHSNIEVVISDNASQDSTGVIGRRLAISDPRLSYFRQDTNIGAAANFRYLLRRAQGEFFMWAAPGDRREPTFVEANLQRLQSDPRLVCSISQVRWIVDGVAAGLAPGTAALEGTVRQNVTEYLRFARDNSRFYGLFRTEALAKADSEHVFFALDLAMMLGTLMQGNHAEVGEVLMTRERNRPETYILAVDDVNRPGLDRWFPMVPFTKHVVRRLKIPLSPGTVLWLMVRNVYEHLRYAALRASPYGRLAGRALRVADGARARMLSKGS